MLHEQRRTTSLRLSRANFAFTYAVRYFAYRYFYFYFMKMKSNAQRVLATAEQ